MDARSVLRGLCPSVTSSESALRQEEEIARPIWCYSSRKGRPAPDKEIRATTEIADLDEQAAAVNRVEQKALREYAFLPLFSGPSTYSVKKGLANVGVSIFCRPLPETAGWEKQPTPPAGSTRRDPPASAWPSSEPRPGDRSWGLSR
ncbi:hypothetical protein ACIBBE_38995 [Streptomyces sp. NPDC051644]|uniref:hypothetical protein n=1 Tax=Streptomyces sp. NPDC051644 TaxID=3365666 RepID=UPI00378FA338